MRYLLGITAAVLILGIVGNQDFAIAQGRYESFSGIEIICLMLAVLILYCLLPSSDTRNHLSISNPRYLKRQIKFFKALIVRKNVIPAQPKPLIIK